jgi:phospholipase C
LNNFIIDARPADRAASTKESNVMANQLSQIKYFVQLMMENRSFDQMLGFLYADSGNRSPTGQPYEGLTGNESNPDSAGRDVKVFKIDHTHKHPYFMPGADPGEGFLSTNWQLFSAEHQPPGATATNQGFVVDFEKAIASDLAKHFNDTLPDTVPSDIMGMYPPDMLPIMSALARGFAVCDHWFCSAPTQTIPNRAFAGAATSLGHLDNKVKIFTVPSIFGRFSDADLDWAIYGYNKPPLTRLDFPDTKDADESHFGTFDEFRDRALAGKLPPYTFLEPSFGSGGNSQHPNYDVAAGEQLFHDVYYALRNGKGWNNTLLLITYDEHGGNYDHVAPPDNAVTPDDSVGEFDDFDFTRFGVRVPALLISPLIPAGTVFRARSGTIDHTSFLKTLEERWGLPNLTERDKAAPSLGDVLSLKQPRTDDPLAGIPVPSSGVMHPHRSHPSKLEMVQAERVAQLPVPNAYGAYDHEDPDLSSSAKVTDFIRGRTAAWIHHRSRSKPVRKPRPAKRAVRSARKRRK